MSEMQRESVVIGDHRMELIPDWEMGGGSSGINLLCWSCDPVGSRYLMTCPFWPRMGHDKVYTANEALIELRKAAWKHANPKRQK